MTARDIESAMLDRCVAVAQEAGQSALNQREANVFWLAAMVIVNQFPSASKRLMQASEQYFSVHPSEKIDPEDVIRNGWVITLPRLRDRLSRRFNGRS